MRNVLIVTPAGALDSNDPNASVTAEIRPMTVEEEAAFEAAQTLARSEEMVEVPRWALEFILNYFGYGALGYAEQTNAATNTAIDALRDALGDDESP